MKAERWQKLRTLFHQALEHDPPDRAALLANLQRESPDLHSELAALLQADEALSSGGDPIVSPDVAEIAPAGRLGQYRILRLLGRGGMSSEAVREGDDARHTVAIKVLTHAVPDEQRLRDFQRERQALGNLDHPNITRLLDWGTTPAGYAYLVMENVRDSKPLDAYCGAAVRQAVELFLQVCDAVSHAHRNLIVHRDLKPANVLVAGDGRVKLLDFGIAKLLDSGDTTTLLGNRRLTPAYASPEQIVGAPVTTATDVYSLGVLLCELLTGALPYAVSGTGFHEIAWSVLQQDPRRPSELEGLTGARRRELAGDLDRVVLMAIRKEPERRYASVDALADDLRAFLAGRPVQARGDAWLYRGGKFLRRNWLTASAVILAFLSLTSGAVIAMSKSRLAEARRAEAERRFGDVLPLAHALTFDVHDSILQNVSGSAAARAKLASTVLQHLEPLVQTGAADATVRAEITAAYQLAGDIHGWGLPPESGVWPWARASFEHARDGFLGARSSGAGREWLLMALTNLSAAEADPRRAAAALDEIATPAARWGESRRSDNGAARALALLGEYRARLSLWMGDYAGAERDADAAARLFENAVTLAPSDWRSWRDRASAVEWRGHARLRSGDGGTALRAYDEAADFLARAATAEKTADLRAPLARVHCYRAEALLALGDLQGAMAAVTRAIELTETRVDQADVDWQRRLAIAYSIQALIILAEGRSAAAVQKSDAAAKFILEALDQDPSNAYGQWQSAVVLNRNGKILLGAREPDRGAAQASFERALEAAERALRTAPTHVEALRERAHACAGLASTTSATDGRSAREWLDGALQDWRSLRKSSPFDREAREEETAAEALRASVVSPGVQSESTSGRKPPATQRDEREFDLVADFQSPAFSYGYISRRGSVFHPLTVMDTVSVSGITALLRSGRYYQLPPYVARNRTGAPLNFGLSFALPADVLHLHPGVGGEAAAVRFTAKRAGVYGVSGAYVALDITTTDVHVMHNETAVFQGRFDAKGQMAPFTLTLRLDAGDRLDFTVGYGLNGDYYNDSTGLRGRIARKSTESSAR